MLNRCLGCLLAMTGVPSLPAEWPCGILVDFLHLSCKSFVSIDAVLVIKVMLFRISIPYTPPLRRYITIQEIAHRLPNLKYQVYFSDPNFTPEVEAAVRFHTPYTLSLSLQIVPVSYCHS